MLGRLDLTAHTPRIGKTWGNATCLGPPNWIGLSSLSDSSKASVNRSREQEHRLQHVANSLAAEWRGLGA